MKKNILFVAAMLVAGSAVAQTADSGVYIGIEGAYATIDGIAAPTGARKTSETTDVGAVRALIGYQFNKNLGLELGYFATDDFKQSGVAGLATYDAKVDAKGVDLALVYKFTEFVPGLYLKGGAVQSKVSSSVTARAGTATASGSASDSGTGYLLGLGYEFGFSQNLGARIGYTRYESLGGKSDNKANLYSIGLKYKF